ncbi:procathepsin L-like [Ruditapes philippinarum]|uniref:procathepsin L-like n=1 Tax=Ruditapes philippinarum TaxID=129788 RepID=UPI00295AC61E|nr:procathepsin L-like [Ruditapes philippinarum]
MVCSTLISLVVCFGVSLALNSWELPQAFVNSELDQNWMWFKKAYNKSFTNENEEITRRLYWEDNMKFIRQHNEKYYRGEVTYSVGENDFADMADDEFEKTYLRGLIVPEGEENDYPEGLTEPDVQLPRELDWRVQGLVSSVKNQGKCGSCWAFSALGALEGQVIKNHGGSEIPDLSEQNLVDCAKGEKYHNLGCKGGWMHNAYQYIKDNGGIDSEFCYPYRAIDQTCRYIRECRTARDCGYKKVGRNEYSLRKALSNVGPIAIAMDVNHKGFWFYKEGIFYEPACNGTRPTHAMVAVGYGKRGGRYWIIKNSWGEGWGNKGYVYAARGRGDLCGIAKWGVYPTGV